MGELVGAGIELAIGEGFALEDGRGGAGARAGLRLEEVVDARVLGVGRVGAIETRDLLAFPGRQHRQGEERRVGAIVGGPLDVVERAGKQRKIALQHAVHRARVEEIGAVLDHEPQVVPAFHELVDEV
jgi:hypothetical protein